jgi:virulence-associated protein VagC
MDTAKVFTNSHSQAIRLPKDYRVPDSEVFASVNPVSGAI